MASNRPQPSRAGPLDRETERLLGEAERARAASIRTRIQTAFTFLGIAQSEAQFTSVERAEGSMAKVRHVIQELEGHIREPRYVPPENTPELRDLLQQLRSRAEQVDLWISSLRRDERGAHAAALPKSED